MKLKRPETLLEGKWTFDGKSVEKDSVCKRIDILTKEYLKKIGTDESGWIVLYQDLEDGRYWELSYPNGDYHGGGPPSLTHLDKEKVRIFFVTKDAKE